ncbi:MAG TPA: hypothetical protein VHB48_04070 [Chitinophagaceae bacterium]|nr:hypothetical protein [Chitinophagaceae bacterium]
MEIQLIDGVFTTSEAEILLQEIFRVKIQFLENRINTSNDSAEDVEHSEKRLIELQKRLNDGMNKIKSAGKDRITLHAVIELTTASRLTQ